jgi:hypothetical protein
MTISVIVNNSEEIDVVGSGAVTAPLDVSIWQVGASSPDVRWRSIGTQSLRYSDPTFSHYDIPGFPTSGTVTSQVIQISDSNHTFNFDMMLDIEVPEQYDQFSLQILTGPLWSPNLVLTKEYFSAALGQTLVPFAIDLSSYTGSEIKLHFAFDTVDGTGNSATGVTITNTRLSGITNNYLDEFKFSNRGIYSKSFVLKVDRVVAAPAVRLKVTPFTPGGDYTLSCRSDGLPVSDDFVVPAGVENPAGDTIALIMPREHGILEALTFAVGRELQTTWGRPTTRVAFDYKPGDDVLRVNSTLGFPNSGSISVDGILIQYTEKADTAFLVGDYRYVSFSIGDIVTSDVKSIESGSRTFLLPDE